MYFSLVKISNIITNGVDDCCVSHLFHLDKHQLAAALNDYYNEYKAVLQSKTQIPNTFRVIISSSDELITDNYIYNIDLLNYVCEGINPETLTEFTTVIRLYLNYLLKPVKGELSMDAGFVDIYGNFYGCSFAEHGRLARQLQTIYGLEGDDQYEALESAGWVKMCAGSNYIYSKRRMTAAQEKRCIDWCLEHDLKFDKILESYSFA